MGVYRYKAKTIDNKADKGILEASSKEELIKKLKSKGLYCYEVVDAERNRSYSKRKKAGTKDLADFCYKMSTMLKSGISLSKALSIIYGSSGSKQSKAITMDLYEGVQRGQSLSDTMKEIKGVFPPFLAYMTEIGETSGSLETIMASMSKYYEGELRTNNKLRTAMTYPVILIAVTLISVTFILTAVFPKFVIFFQGMELPLLTRMLLAVSGFLTGQWRMILLVIIVLGVLWLYMLTIPSIKMKVHKMKLEIPVFGKLMRTVSTSKFSTAFSILYASGVSVITCMELTSKILSNLYIEKKLGSVTEGLKQGIMISESIESINIFDKLFTSMVMIGEESGTLDEALRDAGAYYEKEADNAVKKMVALAEPMMIVFLAIIIGFMIIAIIMPLFSMYSQVM